MLRVTTAALALAFAVVCIGCAATPRSEVRALARDYEAPCPPGTSEQVTTDERQGHGGPFSDDQGALRTAVRERRCIDSAGRVSGQRVRLTATEVRPANKPLYWKRSVDAQSFEAGVPSGLRITLREWQGGAALDHAYVFGGVLHGRRQRHYLVGGSWKPTEIEDLDHGIVRSSRTSEGVVTTSASGETIWDTREAKGTCRLDKRDGVWSLHHHDWPESEREYRNGVAHGRFTIRDQVVGTYVDGLPSGKWSIAFPHGEKACLRPLPTVDHGCVRRTVCGLELPPRSNEEQSANVFDWDGRSAEERERFREPIARCEAERPEPLFNR